MPRYFHDTSALAKLYSKEIGSDLMDRLFADPQSVHIISRLSIVELSSALALKVRTGEITVEALNLAQRRLHADLGNRRLLVAAIRDEHYRVARRLLLRHGIDHGLRTLDALQLAVALSLRDAGFAGIFVASDTRICRIAAVEGFDVVNPEQPVSVRL